MGCQETKGQKPRAKLLGYFSEAEKLWYLWIQLGMNWNTLVSTTMSGMTFKNSSVIYKKNRNSLVVQWLGLHTFTVGDQVQFLIRN